MPNKPKIRATDEDLGTLQKTYVAHLLNKVKGVDDGLELTSAEHMAIRNLLKDNGIEITPDIPRINDRNQEVELELLDAEVTDADFKVG